MPKKDSRLIVYEKMCNLIFYSKNLMLKFPKFERFGICTEIKKEVDCLRLKLEEKKAKLQSLIALVRTLIQYHV